MRIFVEKLPSSCFYCDCCHARAFNPWERLDGEKFCGIENEDVDRYYKAAYDDILERPDWCPLEEIPKSRKIFNNYDDYLNGVDGGWNAFREEMLGE